MAAEKRARNILHFAKNHEYCAITCVSFCLQLSVFHRQVWIILIVSPGNRANNDTWVWKAVAISGYPYDFLSFGLAESIWNHIRIHDSA